MVCSSVVIKFTNASWNSEHISALEVSGAKKLEVRRAPDFITVSYLTEGDVVIKTLNYNSSTVREFTCSGVFHVVS